MKNPFLHWKKQHSRQEITPSDNTQESALNEEADTQAPEAIVPDPEEEAPHDSFIEWSRTQIRGGIERRERNDIFEAYSVFGTDEEKNLVYRRYHRYPEHEKDFSLSMSRQLSFDEFNRRLLSELDRNDLNLSDYSFCISQASRISDWEASDAVNTALSDDATTVLKEFCESADILQNKSYLLQNGIFRCECESVIGEEKINIWFRRPIAFDSITSDIAGVLKKSVEGYDIDNLWIMGVYNRLRERCTKVYVWRLTSEWSVEKESLYLFQTEGLVVPDGGVILVAAGNVQSFRRFGFYSLDFSRK